MLNRLHIQNFKCFEALSLPLSPMTLLTGFNAAGKPTTIQAMLLLAQTQRQGGRLPLVPLNGPLTRLGSPGDVLRDGGRSELVLGIETAECQADWLIAPDVNHGGHVLHIKQITWQIGRQAPKTTAFRKGISNLLPQAAPSPLKKVTHCLAELIFLSAMRIGTTEVFPAPEQPDPVWADVGSQGEFAAWWFEKQLDAEVDPARRHPNESASILRKQFNAWASELFPGAEANAQRISGTSLVRLELRNHDADEWRRPANIGYGLTYAFPILVAGLIAKPGQLLIIDSPEAHLHPLGQSRMGSFLAMLATSGVQVIVETHSDHVLNGVRLAIKSGALSPEQTAIHFFNYRPRSGTDPAHVVSPQVDATGNLSEWPLGFFDQAERDMAVLVGWD
jgi:predicted ATPase